MKPGPRRSPRFAAAIPLAAALLAAAGRAATAQPDTSAFEMRFRVLGTGRYTVGGAASRFLTLRDSPGGETAPVSQHPMAPLTAPQSARLRQAQALRASGQLAAAGAALAPLLRELPHHPAVLTEQARQLLARQDFAAAEHLGRSERAAQKDSLLLGRELERALEQLGRAREAAGVAFEAWLASPEQGGWAGDAILRLSAADPRAMRDAARRAVDARPGRQDLALVKAMLDWRAGELETALRTLERADAPGAARAPLRWEFAQNLLANGAPRDSVAALETLARLAADRRFEAPWRLFAAQGAWEIAGNRGAEEDMAPRLAGALEGVPSARWSPEFLLAIVRGLRQGGHTDEARALLQTKNEGGSAAPPGGASPQLDLEEALADLRDGPPARALPRLRALADATPEGAWRYAEALFYAGQSDSALSWYQRIATNPEGSFSGSALERTYLIEDAQPRTALPALGRAAYEEWRGDRRQATAIADSLFHVLPRGATWAQAALWLAEQRDRAGDVRGALEPLLAVADSLPDDRLAPLARQQAGDLYLEKLKDERAALAQYEECLIRYPKAWNAPEVRRRAEKLRREPRF